MANGTQAAEQQALKNILESQAQGGGVMDTGKLGAGADVPAVLDQDPAVRQLLEEAIKIRTGQGDRPFVERNAAANAANTGGTPDIVTSDQARSQYDNLTGRMDDLTATNNVDITSALNSQIPGVDFIDPDTVAGQALIEQQRKLIQTSLEQQIAGIQAQFGVRQRQQGEINKGREGATRALLGRTGASTFVSGKAASSREAQRSQDAINELTALEAQAINAAKQAAAGQDIELLSKSIQLAEDARNAKNELRQQEFQNFISSKNLSFAEQEAEIAKKTFESGQAGDVLSSLSTLSLDTLSSIDQARFDQLGSQLGLTGDEVRASLMDQAQQVQSVEAVDRFNRIMELGGVGALGEQDIQEFAAALQIPDAVLQDVVRAAQMPNTKLQVVGGDLVGVTQNTDGTYNIQLLHETSKASSGGGVGTTPSKITGLAQDLLDGLITEEDLGFQVEKGRLTLQELSQVKREADRLMSVGSQTGANEAGPTGTDSSTSKYKNMSTEELLTMLEEQNKERRFETDLQRKMREAGGINLDGEQKVNFNDLFSTAGGN